MQVIQMPAGADFVPGGSYRAPDFTDLGGPEPGPGQ
jgi:hypothetical protein